MHSIIQATFGTTTQSLFSIELTRRRDWRLKSYSASFEDNQQ